MSEIQDRPYQQQAVKAIFDRFDAGDDSTLLVLPTGTGKTVVAGQVCQRWLDESRGRVLFLAHRGQLIDQTAIKFEAMGLEPKVEMGNQSARTEGLLPGFGTDVVVGTIQSLQRDRLLSWPKDHFGLIITDEAHHSRADSYKAIYDHFSVAKHLGITATPDRADKKQLGKVYESIAFEYPLRTAIKEGYLVPISVTVLKTDVRLQGLKKVGGDFNQADLEKAISPFIEPLARLIAESHEGRPTVVFTPDVGTAALFADALTQLGVTAQHVAGQGGLYGMPRDVSRERLEALATGKLQAITVCDLVIEGWDCPPVSCVAIARPTRSRSRYAQMVGRGTRPSPATDKTNLMILDFAWNTDKSSRDLVSSIDIFGDDEPNEKIREKAKDLLAEGKERDPKRAVERARSIIADELRVRLENRKTTAERWVYDPISIGHLIGVQLKTGTDFTDEPASEKQLAFLRNMKINANLDSLSKRNASALIGNILKRNEWGGCSPGQIQLLRRLGVSIDAAQKMTKREASTYIDQVKSDRETLKRASVGVH